MQKRITQIALCLMLLAGIASCAHRSYGGHRPGGNLTRNYHDGHLGR